jgi:hypothetical protein
MPSLPHLDCDFTLASDDLERPVQGNAVDNADGNPQRPHQGRVEMGKILTVSPALFEGINRVIFC